jgi:hypothetical protein
MTTDTIVQQQIQPGPPSPEPQARGSAEEPVRTGESKGQPELTFPQTVRPKGETQFRFSGQPQHTSRQVQEVAAAHLPPARTADALFLLKKVESLPSLLSGVTFCVQYGRFIQRLNVAKNIL